MEFVGAKRDKKRKRRRRTFTKKHRDQVKSEVKFSQRKKSTTKANNFLVKKKEIVTMEANAFWENYKAAHEWQDRYVEVLRCKILICRVDSCTKIRHNSTWWKARCFALEHENHLLKDTIRDLVKNQDSSISPIKTRKSKQQNNYPHDNVSYNSDDANDETFEFQLDEGMMSFLAQSMRHKIELKNKKQARIFYQNEDIDKKTGVNAISLAHKRNEDAKLLYGANTSKILAMETALQATIEKHIDKSKPQYWPNIPLKI